MHDTVGALIVKGDCARVAVASPIRIDQHSAAVYSHAKQLPETEIETRRRPATIIVVTDLRVRLVPETRVICEPEGNVDSSTRQAQYWSGKLEVAAARAAIDGRTWRISDSILWPACRPVIGAVPTATSPLLHRLWQNCGRLRSPCRSRASTFPVTWLGGNAF